MKRHPYGIVDPFLRVDIADGILGGFFHIAGQLKIRACIIYGLCLGFVRDGGYIEGDNDLDLGVICNEDGKQSLMNSLKENGFNQGRSYCHNNTHFHKNKVLVDVYFLKSGGFFSNFDSVHYKGRSYPVPFPIDKYLSTCYSNWRIKKDEATRYYHD